MIWWFLVTYFFDKPSKKYPMLISVLHTFSGKIILLPEKSKLLGKSKLNLCDQSPLEYISTKFLRMFKKVSNINKKEGYLILPIGSLSEKNETGFTNIFTSFIITTYRQIVYCMKDTTSTIRAVKLIIRTFVNVLRSTRIFSVNSAIITNSGKLIVVSVYFVRKNQGEMIAISITTLVRCISFTRGNNIDYVYVRVISKTPDFDCDTIGRDKFFSDRNSDTRKHQQHSNEDGNGGLNDRILHGVIPLSYSTLQFEKGTGPFS